MSFDNALINKRDSQAHENVLLCGDEHSKLSQIGTKARVKSGVFIC